MFSSKAHLSSYLLSDTLVLKCKLFCTILVIVGIYDFVQLINHQDIRAYSGIHLKKDQLEKKTDQEICNLISNIALCISLKYIFAVVPFISRKILVQFISRTFLMIHLTFLV